MTKVPKLWYVATYGEGGLEVEHFADPLAYGRAVKAAERKHERESGPCFGESSYTNGEVYA